MENMSSTVRYRETASPVRPTGRTAAGRWLVGLASVGLGATVLIQALHAANVTTIGFENWRPILYAYIAWSIALGVGQVMSRGEAGQRALFLLPALLFTIALVIF